MIIKFTLTMPNVNSWNGRWSGEGHEYSICRAFRTNAEKARAAELIDKDYYHNFGDGWTACISCTQIDSKEAAKSRKRSAGFAGYDWMIDSLIKGKYNEKLCRFYD